MELELTREVLDALAAQARAAAPAECCGMLLGEGMCIAAIRPAANVHPEPLARFEIDPQALIDAHRAAREGGPRVLGYYHSHPAGPAGPSATDRAMALGDGSVWAIVAPGGTRFWRDGPAGFAELSTRVVSG